MTKWGTGGYYWDSIGYADNVMYHQSIFHWFHEMGSGGSVRLSFNYYFMNELHEVTYQAYWQINCKFVYLCDTCKLSKQESELCQMDMSISIIVSVASGLWRSFWSIRITNSIIERLLGLRSAKVTIIFPCLFHIWWDRSDLNIYLDQHNGDLKLYDS